MTSFIMQPFNKILNFIKNLFTSENKMSITYVKIKIVSLAAEAQLIRNEERKIYKRFRNNPKRTEGSVPPDTFFGLRAHRHWDVRNEARAAQLAYAFLRGVPFAKVETLRKGENTRSIPYNIYVRTKAIAEKYGNKKDVKADLDAWLKAKD